MITKGLINRRRLLRFTAWSAISTSAIALVKSLQLDRWSLPISIGSNFSDVAQIPLKEHSASKGLIYGADCGTLNLASDQALAAAMAQECGMLVAAMLKWEFMRPTADEIDFETGDWYAKFAQEHNMLLRGHTLVWHVGLPSWIEEIMDSSNAEQIMVTHIQTVAQHYAGQMHSWDVVNEAIHPDDGRNDGLRQSLWLKFLGPSYIDLAFRAAAEADPHALLTYNDYGLEYDRPADDAKRAAVLKLLERLKASGTPVHALGIQSHLGGDATDFDPNKLRRFLSDVASLGLKILITELDVIDQKLPADIAIRDRIVASVYEDYLSVVLDEPAVIAVLTWGLSDRYTWLSQFNPRPDHMPVRPLPLDDQLNRKLAWNAMARAFDNAPKR